MASYTWLHPEARLSDAEHQWLMEGLWATFGIGEEDEAPSQLRVDGFAKGTAEPD